MAKGNATLEDCLKSHDAMGRVFRGWFNEGKLLRMRSYELRGYTNNILRGYNNKYGRFKVPISNHLRDELVG